MDRDFAAQLSGRRLTTAEVLYYMPAHPQLLQSFLWQTLDVAPDFPRIHRFLDYWRREIDAVIQSLPSIAVLVKEHPDAFEVAAPIETGVNWTYQAWVTRPEDADLRDFISSVIYKMRDDGRLYALQDKWFGFQMEIPDDGYLPPGAV